MVEHLRREDPFMVRIGPPVVVRHWTAEALRKSITAGNAARLRDVPATVEDPRTLDLAASLRAAGWRSDRSEDGLGRIQPRHRVQVPLAGRTLDQVFAGCGKTGWQRNIRKAERSGVEVSLGSDEDPKRFRLYVARHDGEVAAASITVTVGEHVWCAYTASAEQKRDVRPSNAIQWRMLSDLAIRYSE